MNIHPRRKRVAQLLVIWVIFVTIVIGGLYLTSPQRNSIDCTATPRHCVD